ncbi:hypothetical protein LguiB_018167 [Lonicera macranthoides]
MVAISTATIEHVQHPFSSTSRAAVYIVYTKSPVGESPKSYDLRILASALGSTHIVKLTKDIQIYTNLDMLTNREDMPRSLCKPISKKKSKFITSKIEYYNMSRSRIRESSSQISTEI